LEEAERSYLKAYEINPDSWEVCNNLGQVFSLRGKLESALEYFRKAKELEPTTLAPRQNIWTNLFLLGRIEEAETELNDTLARLREGEEPELKQFRARALNDLGAIYYRQGKYDEAIEKFRESLALFPLFPTAQQGLGDAWLAKGEVAQAAAHYEEALRMNPNDQVVREKLLALRGEQAPDAAGQPPMDPQTVEEMRRRAAESLNRRREALAANPDDPQAHYEMGVLLAQMGQLEQSISHLQQAITLRPDLAGAYYHLTAVFLRTSRAAEAEATARRGLIQLPEETSLMGLLAQILATSNDPQVVAPAEALEWAEKAVGREPDNASLLQVKGVALAANERFDEALEVLGEAKARAEATDNRILAEKVSKLIEIYRQRRGGQTGAPPGAEETNE
jgi:tetratricopeptide (TPR) repeat protein